MKTRTGRPFGLEGGRFVQRSHQQCQATLINGGGLDSMKYALVHELLCDRCSAIHPAQNMCFVQWNGIWRSEMEIGNTQLIKQEKVGNRT